MVWNRINDFPQFFLNFWGLGPWGFLLLVSYQEGGHGRIHWKSHEPLQQEWPNHNTETMIERRDQLSQLSVLAKSDFAHFSPAKSRAKVEAWAWDYFLVPLTPLNKWAPMWRKNGPPWLMMMISLFFHSLGFSFAPVACIHNHKPFKGKKMAELFNLLVHLQSPGYKHSFSPVGISLL